MKVINLVKDGYKLTQVTTKDKLEVTLIDLGASIYSIRLDGKIMTFTPVMFSDYVTNKTHYGKTLGRVAGRIANAKVTINGETFKLDANENNETCLHGGSEGISTKIFDVNVEELNDKVVVTYSYLSKHLEGGFPGNVNIKVIYTIFDNLSFDITFLAIPDKDTPISLSNHAYFTLGEKDISTLSLEIPSTRYLVLDDKLIPIREEKCPECLDFSKIMPIFRHIHDDFLMNSKPQGYDHYFVFDDKNKPIRVESKDYELDIFAKTLDGVVIYTQNHPGKVLSIGSGAMQYRSVAIEPEVHMMSDKIIKAGKEFNHTINYIFKRK